MEAKVHCKVFEDNSRALKIARNPKYHPRTKHLNIKINHFCDYVECKEISIHPIESENQPADYLTKPVAINILLKLWRIIMGW